jgi:toxin ParE1/3/4
MARFRVARPAQADIAHILAVSEEQWGIQGQRRYSAMLAAAMRQVAASPASQSTRARAELGPGIRSFHLRYTQRRDRKTAVKRPVHILYYRVIAPDLVEVVRVLHERMEPGHHLDKR